MQLNLLPHPTTPPALATTVWARAERSAAFGDMATLNLWFGIRAPLARYAVPVPSDAPSRREALWQSTCFECFLKEAGEEAYQEWNFSPSGDWAAYDFSAEREDMSLAEVANPPYIRVEDNLTWWGLGATLAIPADATFTLGLSAVLEESGGRRTYWALHHIGPAPDFHDPDCFTARLA